MHFHTVFIHPLNGLSVVNWRTIHNISTLKIREDKNYGGEWLLYLPCAGSCISPSRTETSFWPSVLGSLFSPSISAFICQEIKTAKLTVAFHTALVCGPARHGEYLLHFNSGICATSSVSRDKTSALRNLWLHFIPVVVPPINNFTPTQEGIQAL